MHLLFNKSFQFQEGLIIHNTTLKVLINRSTVAIKHVKYAVKLRIYLSTREFVPFMLLFMIYYQYYHFDCIFRFLISSLHTSRDSVIWYLPLFDSCLTLHLRVVNKSKVLCTGSICLVFLMMRILNTASMLYLFCS